MRAAETPDTVTGGVAACTRSNPTIAIAPISQTGEIGRVSTYTLTIKNNDNSCTDTTYNITAAVPTGLNLDVKIATINVAAGKSSTYNFKVSPGVSTANGVYQLAIAVKDSANTYNVAATYNLVNLGATPPVINISGLISGQVLKNGNNKVDISATHGGGIATINVYLNGTKVQTCTNPKNGSCDYGVNNNKINPGVYVLMVEAIANDSAKTTNTKSITFTK